jgi:hypothetical protein
MTVTLNVEKTNAVPQDEVRTLFLDVSPGKTLVDDEDYEFEVRDIVVLICSATILLDHEFVFTVARGEGNFRQFSGYPGSNESSMFDAPDWYVEAVTRIIEENR